MNLRHWYSRRAGFIGKALSITDDQTQEHVEHDFKAPRPCLVCGALELFGGNQLLGRQMSVSWLLSRQYVCYVKSLSSLVKPATGCLTSLKYSGLTAILQRPCITISGASLSATPLTCGPPTSGQSMQDEVVSVFSVTPKCGIAGETSPR